MLVYSPDQQLLRLLQLACGSAGSKAVTCSLSEESALVWLRRGHRLLYSVVRPRAGLTASCAAEEGVVGVELGQLGISMAEQQQSGGRHPDGANGQAPANGAPTAADGAAAVVPVDAFSLRCRGHLAPLESQGGAHSIGSIVQYTLSLSPVPAVAARGAAAAAAPSAAVRSLVGSKRKQPEEASSAGQEPARQPQGQAGQQQQQPLPPPPSQQQHAPRVRLYYSNAEGSRVLQQDLSGFRCPFSVCGIACRGYAGLRQHLQASHSYHEYYFGPPDPATGACEIFARCQPGAQSVAAGAVDLMCCCGAAMEGWLCWPSQLPEVWYERRGGSPTLSRPCFCPPCVPRHHLSTHTQPMQCGMTGAAASSCPRKSAKRHWTATP